MGHSLRICSLSFCGEKKTANNVYQRTLKCYVLFQKNEKHESMAQFQHIHKFSKIMFNDSA